MGYMLEIEKAINPHKGLLLVTDLLLINDTFCFQFSNTCTTNWKKVSTC